MVIDLVYPPASNLFVNSPVNLSPDITMPGSFNLPDDFRFTLASNKDAVLPNGIQFNATSAKFFGAPLEIWNDADFAQYQVLCLHLVVQCDPATVSLVILGIKAPSGLSYYPFNLFFTKDDLVRISIACSEN